VDGFDLFEEFGWIEGVPYILDLKARFFEHRTPVVVNAFHQQDAHI
jgi:hypothetical protein